MGHRARTLTTLLTTATVALACAPTALALDVKVRAEVRSTNLDNGFIDRQVVSIAPETPIVRGENQCPGDSAIAALDKATSGQWEGTWTVPAPPAAPTVEITRVLAKTVPVIAGTPAKWVLYAGGYAVANPCAKLTEDQRNSELLFYLRCAAASAGASASNGCFSGEPVMIRPGNDTFAPVNPVVVGFRAAFYVYTVGNFEVRPSRTATVSTDEGSWKTDQLGGDGQAVVEFRNAGPHTVVATEPNQVPDRIRVCFTRSDDGLCGTAKDEPNVFVPPPSPCDTNGRDGFCGTTDTSGPVTTVTNIGQKQTFAAKKGPGQVKGTIAFDPGGLKDVRLRLTRVVKTKYRVRIKAKKAAKGKKQKVRYRTKTRNSCTFWNNTTLLLERAKKCGTSSGTWFEADLDDLRANFSYSFAMTMPAGTYVLEVQARDEFGFPDLVTPGRNVLTFTVKSAPTKKAAKKKKKK